MTRRLAQAEDRRAAHRKLVNLKVHHRDPRTKKMVLDFAKDLSVSGLFIWTKRQRVVGDTIELEFEVGDAKKHGVVKATCKVARTTTDGIAAEFLNLDESSATLLNYYLSH